MKRKKLGRKAKRARGGFDGCPSLTSKALRNAAKLAHAFGLVITATTNGVHATTSWHYLKRAIDAAAPMTRLGVARMKAYQLAVLILFGKGRLLELFGPCGWYVKDGIKYQGHFPGHGNHVHVAI